MLIFFTFFLGCIWFLMSKTIQEGETETWYFVFGLDDKDMID
jgi:hypothetical protein